MYACFWGEFPEFSRELPGSGERVGIYIFVVLQCLNFRLALVPLDVLPVLGDLT